LTRQLQLKKAWRAIAVVGISATAATADAQQWSTPSDSELRSAYCISILQSEVALNEQMIEAATPNDSATPEVKASAKRAVDALRAGLIETQSLLDRLRSYLLPRVQNLDALAMLAAMKRAEADLAEVRATTDRCTPRCLNTSDEHACWNSCTNQDLVGRVQSCRHPTWLPF
jgi:hypothetical protein